MDNNNIRKWISKAPERCEVTGLPIDTYFVDGAGHNGYWSLMHPMFHANERLTLGIGRGQLYELQGDEWVMIAGYDAGGVKESVSDYLRYDGMLAFPIKEGKTYQIPDNE